MEEGISRNCYQPKPSIVQLKSQCSAVEFYLMGIITESDKLSWLQCTYDINPETKPNQGSHMNRWLNFFKICNTD